MRGLTGLSGELEVLTRRKEGQLVRDRVYRSERKGNFLGDKPRQPGIERERRENERHDRERDSL